MKALVADLTIPRAGWTAVASTVRKDAPWRRGGVLGLRELPGPSLPGPDWVRVRPSLAGICGSDLKLLHVTGLSPVLTAFNSGSRAVLGHEVVGVVTESGPAAVWPAGPRAGRPVAEGDRVLVEPTVHCRHKGFPPCARCAAGQGHLCENLDRAGAACTGQGIGFSADLGGGWADELVAHPTMLTSADGVSDARGVLAEPASVALHAALRWERAGDTAMVIGPGTIGLLVVAALRRLHPDLDITVVCAGEFGAERARAAGATRTVQQPTPRVLEEVARLTGARLLSPRIGRTPVLSTGVDVVFDCVASSATTDLALRALRGRGALVMVGTAGRQRVDWSLVWWRELTLLGSYAYADEPALGGRRTFDVIGEWLADPAYAVDDLVTHTYGLDDYVTALATASAGPSVGAVKVALRPAGARRDLAAGQPHVGRDGLGEVVTAVAGVDPGAQLRGAADRAVRRQ